MELPRFIGMIPVGRGVAQVAAGVENQLRLAVIVQVAKAGRFVIDGGESQVFCPMPFLALGVFIPVGRGAGSVENQNILLAIAIKIVGERQEIVGVTSRVEGFGRTIFVLFLKVGSLEPKGSGYDIEFTIVIEVAKIGAFGIK